MRNVAFVVAIWRARYNEEGAGGILGALPWPNRVKTAIIETTMADNGIFEGEGEDEDVIRLARERQLLRGYRMAILMALSFVRRYRAEEGRSFGTRELACLEQARTWRDEMRKVRGRVAVEMEGERLRPGLARTRGSERAVKTGGRKVS